MKKNNAYEGIFIEKIYYEGKYVATVYINEYKDTYKVLEDEYYDYYEGTYDEFN